MNMAKILYKMQLIYAKFVQKKQSIHVKDVIPFIVIEFAK